MSGPSTKPSETLANTQTGILNQQQSNSTEDRARALDMEAPAVDLYKGVTSGDPAKATAAAAPILAPLYAQYPAAKEQIKATIAPGVGQDLALADLERGKAGGIATGVSNVVSGAFDKLANLGSGFGAMSLQDIGAALRAGEGAGSTDSTVMQAESNTKASQLGLLGGLAGAAGTAAGGIFRPSSSDRRLKKNIQRLDKAVDLLGKVSVYRFDYIDGPANQIGVMAQEVLEVFPEAVSQDENGNYLVNYSMLAAVALLALKELSRKVQDHREVLDMMENNYVVPKHKR